MDAEQTPENAATIRFLSGPLAEKEMLIQRAVVTIGRDKKNDIVVADPRVSRVHARIYWRDGAPGTWAIENLSQSSYITIDGQRAQRGALQHNSMVSIGNDTRFVFLVQQTQLLSASQTAYAIAADIARVPTNNLRDRSSNVPYQSINPPSTAARKINVPMNASPNETVLAPQPTKGVPSLVVSSNIHSLQQVYALSGLATSIGRGAENDIVIDESIISGKHMQVVCEASEFFLVHPHPDRERTLNGLWYHGQRIHGGQTFRKQLKQGDIVRIGDETGTMITFTFDDGSGSDVEEVSELPPVALTAKLLTIGRATDNTIVLNHPQVSAHHAVLEKVEGSYRIIDTNSTNHVYINGEVADNRLLRTSDEIRIGPYRLIYTGSELKQYDESSHIRIEALNLKKVGNNHVVLLNDISLVIPPRKFVALVGGSGAGKSTLMDALNGLRPAHQGGVYYNGMDYYRNQDAFRTQLGYVPQDDIVHRDLTVQRALYYVARLRLPNDFSDKQIQWRIDEVLEDVDLLDRRDLLVSKLSGGQRKRVSIALELLGNPGIFFLDEPTSGLDPGLDRKMMSLLRRLADRGRTIILVTHATNNINACDYVCFLTQGGRLAFFGPPNEAKEYFDKTDFAEIYNVLEPTREQPDIPLQAEARFRASPNYQRYIAGPILESQQTQPQARAKASEKKARKPGRESKRGNPFMQFLLLSRRYVELLRNDRGNLLILLLQAPIIAIMLVLMVHFEIGQDVFKAGNIVACTPQVITKSGPVGLPNVPQGSGLVDCQKILTYLKDNPQGKEYAKQQGGQEQGLQNFIAMGEGADAQKVMFIMAFAAVLFGCINGSREIVKEAAIYRRERAVNLGILPYLFSKIFVLGTLCLLQSAVLVGIMELGVPLRQGIIFPPILETYITLALTSLGGLMIGLTISVVAPNNDRAISLVPVVLIPQVIFAGAIIPLKGWVIQILGAIFPTRWAMAALGTSVGIHADKIDGDKLFGNDYTYHGTLFSIYDHTRAVHRVLLSWGALGALIMVFMLIIIFFLKRKDIRV